MDTKIEARLEPNELPLEQVHVRRGDAARHAGERLSGSLRVAEQAFERIAVRRLWERGCLGDDGVGARKAKRHRVLRVVRGGHRARGGRDATARDAGVADGGRVVASRREGKKTLAAEPSKSLL